MIEWKYNQEFDSRVAIRRLAQGGYKGAAQVILYVEELDGEYPVYLSKVKDLFLKSISSRAYCKLRTASQGTSRYKWQSRNELLAIEEVYNG